MIISQTPLRVSFVGGGTDLPAFYREEYGAVLSTTVQLHMYVALHARFKNDIRVSYSKTEVVANVDQLKHELVRESLIKTEAPLPIEVTTIADVPSGTGMGSSSALTVGLLNAMYAHRGLVSSAESLAREACEIEIDRLGHPIGKQDQYATAYGGINYIRFNPDESVQVEPVPISRETRDDLESRIMMFYTEQQRSARSILKKQSDGTAEKRHVLTEMRDLVNEARQVLTGRGDVDQFARILHEGWLLKSSLGFGINNQLVDQWYQAARQAGAHGGKLLGAGGGGFLMLLAPPDQHAAIRQVLGNPQELPFQIDRLGSRIVFNNQ